MQPRSNKKRFIPGLGVSLFILLVVIVFPVYSQYKPKPLYTYYNFSFGARAMGAANAFTAVADDLSAVYWNPAGIAEFNTPEAFVNYREDRVSYDYDLQEQPVDSFNNRYTQHFDSQLKSLDFLSISVPAYFWDMKWNFALSYYRYIPYTVSGKLSENEESYISGISSGYQRNVHFSGADGIDVLGFTAAYYFNEYFTLGFTLQQFINTGTVNYKSVYETANTSNKWEDNETYEERLKGRNIIMGFIFKPMEDVSIGMSYSSKLANKFNSGYTNIYSHNGSSGLLEDSVQADVIIPQRLSLGIMARLLPFMRLSVDYFIIYWRRSQISNDFGQAEGEKREFPVRNAYSFRQSNAKNLRAGLEFTIPIKKLALFLRGGLFKENPLFPAGAGNSNIIKIKGYTLGLGLDISTMAFDFAYMRQKANWWEPGHFDMAVPVLTHYKNNMIRFSFIFRFNSSKKKI